MAYIDVYSVTKNSITTRVYGLDPEYAGNNRVCSWYLDGVYKGQSRLGANIEEGGNYTFSGLSPGTDYLISASISASDWDYSVDLDLYASTDGIAISPWLWTTTNGAASTQQTQRAYQAITSQGALEDFSYLVWNDMVDKVSDVQSAFGFGWDSTFLSYANTKMTASDKAITADRFNSLRYNIGIHYATGIQTVSKGDKIYGWYFTRLTDCINNWIDTYG